MSIEQTNHDDPYRRGLAVLFRELGPDVAITFLQRFDSGHGDYTAERRSWLRGQSVEQICKRIEDRRIERGRAAG